MHMVRHQVSFDNLSPIWNGIGFGKALTSKSSFQVQGFSSSHLGRILSERSNLFESHWSNQWLTQTELEKGMEFALRFPEARGAANPWRRAGFQASLFFCAQLPSSIATQQ